MEMQEKKNAVIFLAVVELPCASAMLQEMKKNGKSCSSDGESGGNLHERVKDSNDRPVLQGPQEC